MEIVIRLLTKSPPCSFWLAAPAYRKQLPGMMSHFSGAKSHFAPFGTSKVHYLTAGKGQEVMVFVHGWACNAGFMAGASAFEFAGTPPISLGELTRPRAELKPSLLHDGFLRQFSCLTMSLGVLKQLDAGHVDRARKIAMIPVYSGMDSARFDSVHGLVSLTPEEKEEWTKVARETLDYMLRHTDECDSRDLTVQAGMRGLRYFLTEPDDVRRLDELSEPDELGSDPEEHEECHCWS